MKEIFHVDRYAAYHMHENSIIKRDICSWKGQLEKTRGKKVLSWKVQNEFGKIEVGKFNK